MSGQSLDAEASETVAGVVRLPRRAAERRWPAEVGGRRARRRSAGDARRRDEATPG